MKSTETADDINKNYSKWIITLQVDNTIYYTVWGYDSTAEIHENDTKLLINRDGYVVLFTTYQDIFNAISIPTFPLFDEINLKNWAKQIIEIVYQHREVMYNLDYLSFTLQKINFKQIKFISSEDAKKIVEFINLCSDYAEQVNNVILLNLWTESSVRALWEYMYNTFFWEIPAQELKTKQEELLRNYDGNKCQKALVAMVETFKNHLILYSS